MTRKLLHNWILATVIALTGVFAGAPNGAEAQTVQCGHRQAVSAMLDSKFKETRRAMGLISNQRLMELFVSSSGSWTVVMTRPNGMSCIGAAGKHWQEMAPADKQHKGARAGAGLAR